MQHVMDIMFMQGFFFLSGFRVAGLLKGQGDVGSSLIMLIRGRIKSLKWVSPKP